MRAPRFALSAALVASVLIYPLSACAPKPTLGFTGGVALNYGNLKGGDFDGTKAAAGSTSMPVLRAVHGNSASATTARTTATKTRTAISW